MKATRQRRTGEGKGTALAPSSFQNIEAALDLAR